MSFVMERCMGSIKEDGTWRSSTLGRERLSGIVRTNPPIQSGSIKEKERRNQKWRSNFYDKNGNLEGINLFKKINKKKRRRLLQINHWSSAYCFALLCAILKGKNLFWK